MSLEIDIALRRPMLAGEHIFLIGPGGVGKSTLGAELCRQTDWPLVDLDHRFCDRVGIIGPFIESHGYAAYRAANLKLAIDIVESLTRPTVVVTASGFLAAPPATADFQQALALVRRGYSLTLLPSLDLAEATAIVVNRQMGRGYTSDRPAETIKFQSRFAVYRELGDMLVVSAASADQTAGAAIRALGMSTVAQTPTTPTECATPQ